MRVCVVGSGVAGAMLSWRLAQQPAVSQLTLAPGLTGEAGVPDATGVSGGAIRCFEIAPEQRRLAIDSMAELAVDPLLREWSGYTRCGSVYLPADASELAAAATEIEAVLPGSAVVLDAAGLARRGWAGLDPAVRGLFEAEAGYLSPHRLRQSVLADLARRRRIRLLPAGPIDDLGPGRFTLAGRSHSYDLLVLAAGGWTPGLLRRHGFEATGLRTKVIQYTVHPASGVPSTVFVDDLSDLFGKPVPGGVLLGLPTQAWDVEPAVRQPDLALSRAAAERAVLRFPGLRMRSAATPVTALDCYAEDGMLALRPVAGSDGRLFTFTGGTGSAAKTVLAASLRAATQLATSAENPALASPPLIGRSLQSS